MAGDAGGLITVVGVTALALVTCVSPGATRMYASPWTMAYAAVVWSPALLLLLRAFNPRRPLALPDASWCAVMLAAAAGILASALASPFRGPTLLWSAPLLSGIAAFFVLFDWLHAGPAATESRRAKLLLAAGIFLGAVTLLSMGMWLVRIPAIGLGPAIAARNPFPLGHSNYTAGLALLALPAFVALALAGRGVSRAAWWFLTVLALAMVLTSGSRGGFLGLAALGALHVRAIAQVLRVKPRTILAAGVVALTVFLFLNPRFRASLRGGELNASNLQRAAMAAAGGQMGADRPLLGWGPGATPLAYPLYRAGLNGGTENVLQLHSTPVQLWAELGGFGVLAAVAVLALAFRDARRSTVSAAVLAAVGGYAVFSLTDWQLDVPIFTGALALAAALLVEPAALATADSQVYTLLKFGRRSFSVRVRQDLPALRRLLGLATLLALTCLALLGRRDPAPALNVRALALALEPARVDDAASLLRQSLGHNQKQEIAHFNLGWLLVVRDPVAAEHHFLAAAHLVPDKGGVYFGIGLARLNQGRREDAERLFALECLNDPAFLVSPWWRAPVVAERRLNTLARLLQLQSLVISALPPEGALAREAGYVRELCLWLSTGAPVEHPNTAARAAYFAAKPAPPPFAQAAAKVYRRERTGYPVLMRNLNLPVPADLYDVHDNELAAGEFNFLFPAKGWLASPLLPALLAEADSPKK